MQGSGFRGTLNPQPSTRPPTPPPPKKKRTPSCLDLGRHRQLLGMLTCGLGFRVQGLRGGRRQGSLWRFLQRTHGKEPFRPIIFVRVQASNNHILSLILTLITTIRNQKYLMTGPFGTLRVIVTALDWALLGDTSKAAKCCSCWLLNPKP